MEDYVFRGYEIIEFDADSALAEDREETYFQPGLSTRCVRCDDLVRTSDPRRNMCGHCIAEQDSKGKPKALSYTSRGAAYKSIPQDVDLDEVAFEIEEHEIQ